MFVPNNPILLPKPKFVQCPKCKGTWFWRTWYKGSKITTCSKCKANVVPQEIPEQDIKARLIKCPKCKGLQWYVGNKSRTTCTASGCGRKNMLVQVVTPEELFDMLETTLNESTEEIKGYYLDRIKELR